MWQLKQKAGFTCFFAWSTKERTFSKWGLLTRAPIRVLSSRGSPISIARVLFTTSSTNSGRIFLWTKTRVPLLHTCDEQNILMSTLVRWLQISVMRRDAYLALGQEISHERSSHSVLQISILEDEERRFAPELQSHWLHSLRSHLHNLEREKYTRVFTITMVGVVVDVIFSEGFDVLTFFPVGTLPVKDTLATSGCRQSNPPVSWPPCTTLKRPSGTPASAYTSASMTAVTGVTGEGLNTMELPFS